MIDLVEILCVIIRYDLYIAKLGNGWESIIISMTYPPNFPEHLENLINPYDESDS